MRTSVAATTTIAGVRHREVEVGGVKLHVAEAGDGAPLVLLHGWPQHWWSWRRLIPRLAQTHRVLAPDLRGWGWSDAPAGDYAKSTFVDDIIALLDVEGLERVRIMGHDWGGYTGFLLARPSRARRAVCRPGRRAPMDRSSAAAQSGLSLFASYQVQRHSPNGSIAGPVAPRPARIGRCIQEGFRSAEQLWPHDNHSRG